MSGNIAAPAVEVLVAELGQLRAGGLASLRSKPYRELQRAAEHVIDEPSAQPNVKMETLLRKAISAFDSGSYGDAALALFGLSSGLRASSSARRREEAALCIERTADAFQRRYEADLLADIADQIVTLWTGQELRQTRSELERRHPAESRLAVHWVERFEAYNRLWTPAWALAADLTAYRATLLDPDRPYDQRGGDGVLVYSQEEQADGYAVSALYRWSWFQWQLRQFMLQHGGMWLLSSTEAETKVADLVYEIGWHVTVYNERDHSWLRNAVAQSSGQELDHFISLLNGTTTGTERLREWRDWCAECRCSWDAASVRDDERFPTSATATDVSADCEVHQVVQAAILFCTLIEAEWLRIADWYHLDAGYSPGLQPQTLYRRWKLLHQQGR